MATAPYRIGRAVIVKACPGNLLRLLELYHAQLVSDRTLWNGLILIEAETASASWARSGGKVTSRGLYFEAKWIC